jgi:hypothetical protein
VRRLASGPAGPWAVAAAAAIGAAFAAWIGGWRVVNPTEIGWVMRLDWQYHFLGWHFFRAEPWHFPPGLITTYNAPIGTAIGYTDSIPLVALLLKPFAPQLPMPFQYFGLWLVLCFALQGLFGALLTGLFAPNGWVRVAGGTIFILVPTLLGRVGHPALASHWLLLWALWMYMREDTRPAGWRMHLAWGIAAGLIHPYLAAMGTLILGALALRRVLEQSAAPLTRLLHATGPLAAAAVALLAGWWGSGLFAVSGSENLVSTGLDQYSMNLLAPMTPTGWSRLLPEFPLAREEQAFEGFQYLGAGLLTLAIVACVMTVRRPPAWRAVVPLLAAVLLSAVYALSPRVTVGSDVLLDVTTPVMSQFAVFRATGRFFWPAAYALVAGSVAVIATRLRPGAAFALLAGTIVLQAVDLSGHHRELRQTTHAEAFHTMQETLLSPVWNVVLPRYERLLLYGPPQCGPAPVPFEHPALLAGNHGLSINTAHLARSDRAATLAYCQGLRRDFDAGVVDDDAIYLLNRDLVDRFRANAARPVVCATLDRIPVCVTAASYDPWRQLAAFQ